MPKLIPLDSRFEFIRMAVVAIAAQDGAAGVTFAKVAERLELSQATVRRTMRYSEGVLQHLGLEYLERVWRNRLYMRGARVLTPRVSRDKGVALLRLVVPLDEDCATEHRAWTALAGSPGLSRQTLELVQRRHDFLDSMARHLVGARGGQEPLPAEERKRETIRLRAVIDGLTAGVVEGRITFEHADAVLAAECVGIPVELPPEENPADVNPADVNPADVNPADVNPGRAQFTHVGGGSPR